MYPNVASRDSFVKPGGAFVILCVLCYDVFDYTAVSHRAFYSLDYVLVWWGGTMSRQRSPLSSVLVLILIPAVVAVAVTLIVLYFWDRQREPDYIMLPTYSGTALIPPRQSQGEAPLSSEAGEEASEPGGGAEAAEEEETGSGCENPVHTVASGETLGAIAELYGLPIDDITLMNQMLDPAFDPDFLSIGQLIVIPACGVPTPTPSATPTETPIPTRSVPTPNPTATPPPGGVVRVEVARVLNPGDITNEAVEIINRGTSVARLGGWRLVDEQSGDEFVFPPLNLFPQGAVTVYTGVGEDTAIDVYWGRDEAVWEAGDTVQLYDADDNLQHEFVIPE